MGGAVYRYDAANPSAVKFPAALDGHYFAAEFGRRWIKIIDVNADGSAGQISDFPWRGIQIIDTAFGPDGALYVLDYGTGWGSGDASSALYRIEHNPAGNQAPTARASANRTSGLAPLTVNFSSAGSSDPEGGALTYAWNFGDGGQPQPHLHQQRPAHGDAHGDRPGGPDQHGQPGDHGRQTPHPRSR